MVGLVALGGFDKLNHRAQAAFFVILKRHCRRSSAAKPRIETTAPSPRHPAARAARSRDLPSAGVVAEAARWVATAESGADKQSDASTSSAQAALRASALNHRVQVVALGGFDRLNHRAQAAFFVILRRHCRRSSAAEGRVSRPRPLRLVILRRAQRDRRISPARGVVAEAVRWVRYR